MPLLDRRVTIRRTVSEHVGHGEFQDVDHDHEAWATLLQDKVGRVLLEGGAYGEASRVWRVRFDQRLLDTIEAGDTVSVIYGTEEPDVITAIGEPMRPDGRGERRRFLDLLS